MEEIRAFIAIELPERIRQSVARLQQELQAGSRALAKWVEPGNIHLTLKFLGNIQAAITGDIIRAIEDGQKSAIQAIRDGISAREVIAAVAETLAGHGFKPTGFVGHGMGLDPHEPPDLTAAQDIIIREGMVLAVEVWNYDIKGFTRGGRVNPTPEQAKSNLGPFGNEELILVTKDGSDMLPNFSKTIRTIPRR